MILNRLCNYCGYGVEYGLGGIELIDVPLNGVSRSFVSHTECLELSGEDCGIIKAINTEINS